MSDELTTQVYSPAQGELVDVPVSEEASYKARGFKTGQAARHEALAQGWQGKLAGGILDATNSALLGLPKLAARKFAPQAAQELDYLNQANPKTAIAGDLAGGAAAFAFMPGGAAARVAASAFAGGTGSLDRAIADGDPHLAERFVQGVGIGGLLGAVGEGAGMALAKAAPAFQKATGRALERWSKSGLFEKIYQTSEQAHVASTLANDIDEATLAHIKGPAPSSAPQLDVGAPFPAQRPYAGLTEKPPPLPDTPFASATHIPSEGPEARILADQQLAADVGRENIARASEREALAQRAGQRHNEPPLTTDEAAQLRADYDQIAHDSAASQNDLGARDARFMRDSVPQGLNPIEQASFANQRSAFLAPDPQLEAGFERAGLNRLPSNLEELPEPVPSAPSPLDSATDIPRQAAPSIATEDLPAPQVDVPEPGPLATFQGAGKGVKPPRLPPELPRGFKTAKPRKGDINADAFKYALKSDKSLYTGKNLTDAAWKSAAGAFGLGAVAPGHHVLTSPAVAAGYIANDLFHRAQVAALNSQTLRNYVMGSAISPAIKGSAQVVKNLLEGSSGAVSSAYLTGDVDKDYQAVTDGARAAQANPEAVLKYYHDRYGAIDPGGKFTSALLAHVQNGVNVINQAIPQNPRKPGLLDGNEPYDPPHSVKLRVLHTYAGVNNPFEAMTVPTYQSVAAVAQAHPHTLAEVRQQLAQQLADAKVRSKLNAQQKRDIGIVMGIPTDWINSPAGIASLARIAAEPQQPAPQQGPGQAKPSQPKTVNLGAQQDDYVDMYAAPSQLNAVNKLGGT